MTDVFMGDVMERAMKDKVKEAENEALANTAEQGEVVDFGSV
jgi:hypothetical protein